MVSAPGDDWNVIERRTTRDHEVDFMGGRVGGRVDGCNS